VNVRMRGESHEGLLSDYVVRFSFFVLVFLFPRSPEEHESAIQVDIPKRGRMYF